ncbi:ferritin-like domain-containing protein [Methylosinus sp. Sm6]|uniref:YciE/YciF ferroxidase family protein n=1 Tax=Methylosinus sp. Sm6 TaxID=2866948 RepID=UPI001C996542|nr:ferritin-like domain-containing protein [Methylosinus sp. Sm6]MBY6241624.1 ferritin-like domain-containing protein [Methylosinus sp. Sm6]
MGLFTRDIESLDDLFLHQLQDMYYAEKQIIKAMPTMIDSASSEALKDALQTHLRETEQQVQRLEQVFQLQGAQAQGVECPAIDGIIDEAKDVNSEIADKSVLDSALIASAQSVEHYEISRYGTLIAWAQCLGKTDCVPLLRKTLEEEKAADAKLTGLAEQTINRRAA